MIEQRVVIDTGVIISAFLRKTTPPRQLFDTALQNHIVLFSDATLQELGTRLLGSKFDRYVSLAERVEFLDKIPTFCQLISVTSQLAVCRDPKDDKFLELAVDGRTDLIISGDQDLLVLHPFQGIEIPTPRDALDRLA
jgi:putative PIN family toxin of toxin-antitoxin system